MALQMEDKYPITDIYDQTPAIPENCQWGIFLRNHDELTLEMVTDEERDYMYKVYVKDPKARINLGIRHRLAPLLENNRRKIELMNALLFTLPGTPVIYYGDEIGMGDNFYLGDRDGVRTPMQWHSDRNAGFSEANPQQLYLPLILDPQFHYESVNVELQSRNTSSLLWWMKRVISTRKKYKALSRGDMKFVQSENAKVFAFTRTFEEETMLIVANLSRFAQVAELDLDTFKGYVPVEILSRNRFPLIREDIPYFFTLGAYATQSFILEKVHPELENDVQIHTIKMSKWKDLLKPEVLAQLETEILPKYMMRLRWFGGKGRGMENVKIIDHASIPMQDNNAFLLLLEVSYRDGLPDMYQIPVACGLGQFSYKLQDNCPQSVIAFLNLDGEEAVLYDAIYGIELQQSILSNMASNHHVPQNRSELIFHGNKALRKHVQENPKTKPRVISAEQSNTSITYDNTFYLKIYRKVDRAINPDVELSRHLSETAGFKHTPGYIGAIEWKFGKETMVLGMMQEMVKSTSDGWAYMLDRLDDFNEKILSNTDAGFVMPELVGSLSAPAVFEEVPAAIQELLEANVAENCHLLGQRTAEMHLALAHDTTDPAFTPEPFSLHYQRSLFSSLQSLVRVAFSSLSKNLKSLDPEIRAEAEEVLGMKNEILNILKQVYSRKIDVNKIRIHGDFHLGQVLFTGKDFLILDFEGEPSRSYSERRLKYSALRDVAGMIRSFHYAAFGSLFLDNQIRKEDITVLLPYVEQWYHYMSGFFIKSYMEKVGNSAIVPDNAADLETLLQTYLLQKAIYELNYELNNRPDWVIVPLRGIKAIVEKNKSVAV